jgi:hypothetical protein
MQHYRLDDHLFPTVRGERYRAAGDFERSTGAVVTRAGPLWSSSATLVDVGGLWLRAVAVAGVVLPRVVSMGE